MKRKLNDLLNYASVLTRFKFFLSIDNEYLTQYVIYDTKFVQKLAFMYRSGLFSLKTVKHF